MGLDFPQRPAYKFRHMKRPTPNGRRPKAALEIHLRLWEAPDRALASFIKSEAHKNARQVPQQVRFMLRRMMEDALRLEK